MNPSSHPALDIVTVLVALCTLLFGHEMAAIVGPYVVIVLGAVLGGVWSASRREKATRLETFGYLVAVILGALLFTVPIAEFAAGYFKLADSRPFFAPVALVIAGIGSDWSHIARWAIGLGRAFFEKRAGAAPRNDPPPPGDSS